jgi:hypothetical protein
MMRLLLAATILLGACATAPAPTTPSVAAAMPPEVPRLETPVEIVGDCAGRVMKLTIDGRITQEGRAEARPSGTRWIEQVAPGRSPAELVLELENCPIYRTQISRNGVLNAISISGCNVMHIGA